MGSNGSFYQNGLPLSTAETGLGNVNPGVPVANKANASFYLSGSAYTTLQNADALLAAITAQQALATADAVSALSNATSASLSAIAAAADVVTLGSTALLKGNNLSDVTSLPTTLVNLGLNNVNNTSDANKPLSTADVAALALKAPLASPALTGAPTAPTATALDNSTKLATTAYTDAAVGVEKTRALAAEVLLAPLASPSLTGVPVAPTASPGTATTQLATTAFVDAARLVLVAVDATKAPLASPVLTGVPTAPTAAALNNSTQLATTAYADAAVGVEKTRALAAEALLAPLASAALTGTPTAPTATVGTNNTQLATTAFVLANATSVSPATVAPLMDGTAAVGTSLLYARQDHVHASDTSRAPLASPTFTGVPAAPTATVGTNTTQIATTAFVIANAASAGVASVGGATGVIAVGPDIQVVSGTLQATQSLIGELKWWTTTRIPTNYLLANGAAVSRTTYALLLAQLVFSSTVTFTASSAVISWANHGMSAGDKVKFFTAGTMPTGLTAGTHGYNVGTEYVVSATGLLTGSFQVSATAGGAVIVPTTAGTGTITAVNAPWGDGDGSTTFTLPKYIGDHVRAWDAGAGIDTNRVFGAEQLDAMQGHVHNVPSISAAVGFAGGSNYNFGSTTPSSGPISDGTNGTPRIAAETRPRNQTALPIIRYQ